MTDQGHKPLLDECGWTFGEADEPPANAVDTDGGIRVTVAGPDGESVTAVHDVVGYMEVGAAQMLHVFDWARLDEDGARAYASAQGVDITPEVEAELNALQGEVLLIQRSTYPWERVCGIEVEGVYDELFE
jgi:hypothetical protein